SRERAIGSRVIPSGWRPTDCTRTTKGMPRWQWPWIANWTRWACSICPMKLSVIGCGYLGAVHAASMARLGHDVIGIDIDAAKIASLSKGEAPFFEPGLPEILTSAIASGRLRFSSELSDAAGASVHFIAVGTPQQRGSYA